MLDSALKDRDVFAHLKQRESDTNVHQLMMIGIKLKKYVIS